MTGLRGWVYGRCSGEEKDTGQDVRAQVEQATAGAEARGIRVVGSCFDDGVSGDVHPDDRRGFQAAFLAIAQGKADVLVIRDVSRFSRCFPTVAYDAFAKYEARGLRVLCLREPEFTTIDGPLDPEAEPTRVLTRFIPLWKSWCDLVGIRTSTQEVMAEILAGRRSTKSGLPPGRPVVHIDPEHLAAAQAILARPDGTLAEAHREVQRLRGYFEAKDDRTRAKRDVGKETLAKRLGLRANKPVAPQTPAALDGAASIANGPVDGGCCPRCPVGPGCGGCPA